MPSLPLPPVLAALPSSERHALLDRAVPRRLERGEAAWLAGTPDPGPALLIRGAVKMSARDTSGSEMILRLAWPGELLGELLEEGCEAPLDALAVCSSSLLMIDGHTLRHLMTRHPAAAAAHVRQLEGSLSRTYRQILERSSRDVAARLAGVLLDLAAATGASSGDGIVLQLPIGQTELGHLAGASREATCRSMSSLRRAGIVDYRGRQLQIHRPETLKAIRCGERAWRPFP